MTFTDAYERTIDAKSRLQVPSQIRDILESDNGNRILYVVPGSRKGTLSLYPVAEFEKMARYMDSEPIPDEQSLTFQHMFYSLASRVEMDKQGRVVLPERILRRAGLDTEVMLTGAGNHLALWAKSTYEEFLESNWERWTEVQSQARAASRKKHIEAAV